MSDAHPKFRRESPEQRKLALIKATLSLVAEHGVRGATVRGIAIEANVTQGLIRHYFSSKEELIEAAYAHHMTYMTDLTFVAATTPHAPPPRYGPRPTDCSGQQLPHRPGCRSPCDRFMGQFFEQSTTRRAHEDHS